MWSTHFFSNRASLVKNDLYIDLHKVLISPHFARVSEVTEVNLGQAVKGTRKSFLNYDLE